MGQNNLNRGNIVNNERISDLLKSALEEMIEKGRPGEAIDIMKIYITSQMLSRFGIGTNSLYKEIHNLVNKVSK